jgi:hypothetical protein
MSSRLRAEALLHHTRAIVDLYPGAVGAARTRHVDAVTSQTDELVKGSVTPRLLSVAVAIPDLKLGSIVI